MSVAVVIRPCADPALIDIALASVLAQTARAQEIAIAQSPNVGVARTSARLIMLLDAGERLEPPWLQTACELLGERDDLGFVCCAIRVGDPLAEPEKPGPLTAAETLGRAARGYRAAVFRRELWERLDGFDESLGDCAEVDFWARATASGFTGAILQEPLVRSGHRHPASPASRRRLLDKHLPVAARHGEDVFAAMLESERHLFTRRRELAPRRHELAQLLSAAGEEFSAALDALAQRGVPAFDPGADSARPPVGVPRALIDRALAQLAPQAARPRRTLTIGAGDPFPDRSRAAFDLVVVACAFDCAVDPAGALRACRGVLRPGGRLVVLASAMPIGEGRRRGFTSARLRALLGCEEVQIYCFGNLRTLVAGALGVSLDEDELGEDDPAHPALLGACAAMPRRLPVRRPGRGYRHLPQPEPQVQPRAWSWPAGVPPRRGAILGYGAIAPDAFAGQMALLTERYHPISLERLIASVRAADIPGGAVAVTLEVPAPELVAIADELGVPVTEFREGRSGAAISYSHRVDLDATLRAQQDGYAIGCTTEPGAVTCDSDPLRLPRLMVRDQDITIFGLLLDHAVGRSR